MGTIIQKKKYEYVRKTEVYEGKQYEGWGKTDAEAYKKLAAKIEAAKRGELDSSSNITVETWCKFWLKTYKLPQVRKPGSEKRQGTLSAKSYRMYEEKINGYIIPAIGKRRMRDVNDYDLQAILNSQKGMSKTHVSKIRMVLSALL